MIKFDGLIISNDTKNWFNLKPNFKWFKLKSPKNITPNICLLLQSLNRSVGIQHQTVRRCLIYHDNTS